MSHVKKVALSEQLYRALEQELHAIEQSLGYRQKQLAHRHYLEHDALHGTQSQRQKDHAQSRLSRAIDSVYDRQFQKALQSSEVSSDVRPYALERRLKKRALRRSSAPLQRIADEKIMEEMNTGGFKAIQGKGAPIRNNPATHVLDNLDEKLNKVLINSGCVPDWIALDKTIREETAQLKSEIKEAWLRYRSAPLNRSGEEQWERDRERFRDRTEYINDKIRKLNFEVPSLQLQRVTLNCDSFVDRVTSNVDSTTPATRQTDCPTPRTTVTGKSEELGRDNEPEAPTQLYSLMYIHVLVNVIRSWVSAVVQRIIIGK